MHKKYFLQVTCDTHPPFFFFLKRRTRKRIATAGDGGVEMQIRSEHVPHPFPQYYKVWNCNYAGLEARFYLSHCGWDYKWNITEGGRGEKKKSSQWWWRSRFIASSVVGSFFHRPSSWMGHLEETHSGPFIPSSSSSPVYFHFHF